MVWDITYPLLADWLAVQIKDAGKTGGGAHLEAVTAKARHRRVGVGGIVGVGVQLRGGRAEVVVCILVVCVQAAGRPGHRLEEEEALYNDV